MKPLFSVIFRRDHAPVFPDRCLCCSGDPRGGTAAVRGDETAWWRFVTLKAPACPGCRTRFALLRWGRWAFIVAGAALLYFLLFPYLAPIPMGWMRGVLTVLFLVVAAFACLYAWHYAVPRTVELEASRKWVKLDFADDDYALDFALLNDPGVIATWRDGR